MKVNIINYEGKEANIDVDVEFVNLIFVTVVFGDEILAVVTKDGKKSV